MRLFVLGSKQLLSALGSWWLDKYSRVEEAWWKVETTRSLSVCQLMMNPTSLFVCTQFTYVQTDTTTWRGRGWGGHLSWSLIFKLVLGSFALFSVATIMDRIIQRASSSSSAAPQCYFTDVVCIKTAMNRQREEKKMHIWPLCNSKPRSILFIL